MRYSVEKLQTARYLVFFKTLPDCLPTIQRDCSPKSVVTQGELTGGLKNLQMTLPLPYFKTTPNVDCQLLCLTGNSLYIAKHIENSMTVNLDLLVVVYDNM